MSNLSVFHFTILTLTSNKFIVVVIEWRLEKTSQEPNQLLYRWTQRILTNKGFYALSANNEFAKGRKEMISFLGIWQLCDVRLDQKFLVFPVKNVTGIFPMSFRRQFGRKRRQMPWKSHHCLSKCHGNSMTWTCPKSMSCSSMENK